jgi:ribosome biogenesis protein Nip4
MKIHTPASQWSTDYSPATKTEEKVRSERRVLICNIFKLELGFGLGARSGKQRRR